MTLLACCVRALLFPGDSSVFVVWFGLVWFGLVWFGLSLDAS